MKVMWSGKTNDLVTVSCPNSLGIIDLGATGKDTFSGFASYTK